MPRFTVTLVPADSTGSTYDEVWDFTWTHEYELIPDTTDHRVTGIEGPAGLVDDGWLRVRSVVPLCVKDDAESWSQYKEAGYEGGHLIGRAFGGPDTEYNLVPMNAAVNKGGDWKVWENTVAATLKKNDVYYRRNRRSSTSEPRPETAFDPPATTATISLGLFYEGTDDYVPSHFDASLTIRLPNKNKTIFSRKQAFTLPEDKYELTPGIKTFFAKQLIPFAEEKGWEFKPASEDVSEVNAVLDAIDDGDAMELRRTIRTWPGCTTYPIMGMRKTQADRVASHQRALLIYFVRFLNGGRLLAQAGDSAGNEYPEWQIEIDHDRAKAVGGNIKYANLRTMYFMENRRKGKRKL